ncbi:MAG: tryptophan--tRNA ligase [Solobacterium sp.]|nr:tryptophan--tRNA ligase [Solobacterium sp.]MDY2952704.1 tryptophan--tRNA ligase [Erysipelotrichaceae bacterium]MCI6696572.1 tryptophan--tRNA ligase [Solobacterium sp.]MCI6845562.1 tryptophan--tRNA ligase [Solobacterium sp.]MCI7156887.1 tryptophan--tRNA ligase [Solobacterium sp.]
MKRMLSGIKPTGQLTLGNYIGALRNFVKYQDDYEMIVFIANLHCITEYQEPDQLKKNLTDAVALYLACGLDPEKATIFLQTDVHEHAELGYIMACNTYLGELNRMTQFKDKTAKGEKNLTAGLYTYPCLMAADILLYNADYVPVGEDQKQHVELTRDLAIRFNNKYSKTFTVPEPLVAKVGARIMSLQDPSKKMSKSDETNKGCIYLLDDLKVARKKIMSAVTDSVGVIQLDKENQPGLYNLIEIASSLTNRSMEDIVLEFHDQGYGKLKGYVADIVCAELEKIQTRYNEILASHTLEKVLEEGAKKAEKIAHVTLVDVKKQVGLEIKY